VSVHYHDEEHTGDSGHGDHGDALVQSD
jgi:hypothetical protein